MAGERTAKEHSPCNDWNEKMRTQAFVLVAVALCTVGGFAVSQGSLGFVSADTTPADTTPAGNSDGSSSADEVPAGRFHKRLQFAVNYRGLDERRLVELQESKEVPENWDVVGVRVKDQFYAFDIATLSPRKTHIANLVFDDTPISVSYCDLSDCVRVLTQDGVDPIPLHAGGLDVDNKLVFLLGSIRYSQESKDLPLKDYPFERTTWNKWREKHPDSKLLGLPLF